MSDILSIGLSGLTASRLRALTSANNLANLNTPGYKAQSADTSSLTGGNGAVTDSFSTSTTMGSLIPTGNPLDLAIVGNGYFQVADNQGNNYYTRDGSFSRNENGQMVNSQGFSLSPEIAIPQNAESVTVGMDGAVTAQVGGQQVGGQTVELGNIQLAQFSNPGGLSRTGGNNLAQTGSSGVAQMGIPGTGGLGTIQSGFVEGSNVDIAREAIALRMEESAFKANAAVIRTADEMQREALDLLM